MKRFSGPRPLPRPRQLAVGLFAVSLVLATVSVAGAEETEDDGSIGATVERPLVVEPSPTDWKPSRNARLTTVTAPEGQLAGQAVPRRLKGRKTIALRSVEPVSVPDAGSTVRAVARVKTSQPGRRLRLRVTEVKDGRTVQARSASVRPRSRSWRDLSVTLTTRSAGSEIRLSTSAKRVSRRHVLRVTGVQVTVVPPATSPTDPTGPTDPPPGPVDPPPTTPTTCEDIDYSDPAQGTRTFTEEFDGTAINRDTWRVRDNTFLNQDQAWITKDAVSVHDGYLDITGKRLPDNEFKYNPNANYLENRTRDYSTGYVDTIDGGSMGNRDVQRFGQKYGHFEVRAWVPSEATMSRGIWPAFWLRADHVNGEIDPMEAYGGPTIRSYNPSSSYEWNSWHDTSQVSSKEHTWGRADVGTDKIWQGWHTYGVNWSPNCLRYLYDGRTVGIVDFDAPGTYAYFRGPTFDDTFHIRLNLQVGTKYWGWADPAHTRPSFSYKVDWVRVYQGNGLTPGR